MKVKDVLMLVVLSVTLAASGAVITVDDDGPANFTTIQAALDAAVDGDQIVVQPGTYPGAFFFNSRSVTVSSNPAEPNPIETTIISGEAIFDFMEGPDSVLTGFTLTGGVRCLGSAPTIRDNVLRDTTGKRAITGLFNAAPTLVNNVFRNNVQGAISGCNGPITGNVITNNGTTALSSGGGLLGCNGLIQSNTIRANQADRGGALAECNGTIFNNDISNNAAKQYGGGLYLCNGIIQDNQIADNQCIGQNINLYGGGLSHCTATIRGNQIVANQAVVTGAFQARGGGLYLCNGVIESNTIARNRAAGNLAYGGGLSQITSGTISANHIIANRAESQGSYARGGGIYGCTCPITGNIIEGNSALGLTTGSTSAGGGIYSNTQTVNNTLVGNRSICVAAPAGATAGGMFGATDEVVRNNIFAFNSASDGGGLYGEKINNSYNLFWGNGLRNFGGQAYARTGDIYASPQFAAPGNWNDNGTPTNPQDDVWTAGDYHLQSTVGHWTAGGWVADLVDSPAIDGGDPADSITYEPKPNGGRINQGAFGGTMQASLSPNGEGVDPLPYCSAKPAGDINGDCRVDINDFAILCQNWLVCNIIPIMACE